MAQSTIASKRKPYDRAASQRAVRISLVIVSAFFVIEAVAGWLTNSLALLADAGHLLTDVGTLAMTLIAFWFAARPITPARTYGYYRAEILAALANGLSLWLVSAYVVFQAYHRLLDPPPVLGGPMLLVAFVGFLAQLVAALVLYGSSRDSLNIRGAFVHVATDAVQSIAIIIAGFLMLAYEWYIADPIVSVIVAALIVYTGGRIVFQATHVLLEGTPASVDVVALQGALKQVAGVRAVHDLHTWSITSGYNAMSAHVVLEDTVAPEDGQQVLVRLRDLATAMYGIGHVTIQLEGKALVCDEDHEPSPQGVADARGGASKG